MRGMIAGCSCAQCRREQEAHDEAMLAHLQQESSRRVASDAARILANASRLPLSNAERAVVARFVELFK